MTFGFPVERREEQGAPWLFLSPHLDDAVLSCAALMAAQAGKRDIVVATVFTEASPPPHTRAALSFMRQCGAHDAGRLFEDRRAEDHAVLSALGAQSIHLGAVDALFRRRTPGRSLLPAITTMAAERFAPELTHLYPTYRFDIALGRIAKGDRSLQQDLRAAVDDLMAVSGAELLFCPAGVGNHVDHLMTREAGAGHRDKMVLYSDFPYDLLSHPDPALLGGLEPWTWEEGIEFKPGWIRHYGTQVGALFPDGVIPVKPETYYVSGHLSRSLKHKTARALGPDRILYQETQLSPAESERPRMVWGIQNAKANKPRQTAIGQTLSRVRKDSE